MPGRSPKAKLIAGTGTAIACCFIAALPGSASAATKPGGKARLSVSRLGKPPAAPVVAGDTVSIPATIRNSGRRVGSSPVKLIVPKPGTNAAGKRLVYQPDVRFAPRSKRNLDLSFTVPAKLAPSADAERASWDLTVCVRRFGDGSKFRCKTAKRQLVVGLPPLPPLFKPGGRSAGDDLFPQIGNMGYDATNYDINLNYDPVQNRFGRGTMTTMTAKATQNLGRFSLDFQRLGVTHVLVNGKPAHFKLVGATPRLAGATQPVKLIVDPPAGIPDGSTFRVTVQYHGKPFEITDPDGSKEGWVPACIAVATPLTCDGGTVVDEPVGAAGWFPNNNVPSDKATFDVAVTVPKAYTALGSGELRSRKDVSAGARKWTWKDGYPTATYLATATVGKFVYSQSSMSDTVSSRTLPTYLAIDSTATPNQLSDLRGAFTRMPSMINFLGAHYGDYPFGSVGLIFDEVPTLGYALEVQTKPIFAFLQRDDPTILHELAHQWFGDSVSPAQWSDIWFNEGYAEWSTWYWQNKADGSSETPADLFNSNYASASASDWSIPPATFNGDPANLFVEFPTYIRAPMMLEGLRQIIGENAFFALARDIQHTYAYGNISTAQFIAIAKHDSGLTGADLTKLGDYFQQWLYGNVKPTILPSDF